MYQPALRPDQIKALYFLKVQRRRPMTKLLRDAVDAYLQSQREQYGLLVKESEARSIKRPH
ncbi:MAG: hypothetical protein AB7G75_29415 [Candidatus Binatia bacterium]